MGTVQYSTVQQCTEQYSTVVWCRVQYCTLLYCTVLYCTVHYCTVLYTTVLYYTVTKYIYLSTVIKYNAEVLLLYFTFPIFNTFTSTPLHLRGKYCTFTPLQLF